MNIKRDKTYQARMDGLKYALEIVEMGGIEELKLFFQMSIHCR
jgi:hypothetical protein